MRYMKMDGPLVQRLEKRLAEYLGVKNIVLVSNGTVALEIAYRTLGLKGFVITTPFSFVATTSSLVTNQLCRYRPKKYRKTYHSKYISYTSCTCIWK